MENDTNKEILAELRSMRKWNQWGMIFAFLILVGACAYAYFTCFDRPDDPWDQVDAAMSQEDYPKALELAQKKVAQSPDDYWGHWYLGNIYLIKGDARKAESEYARGYELYPSEDLGKRLEIVRKRLKNEAEKNKKPPANVKK
jgi:cytochrome c-type biogenesis protein CcmH/NrfG